MCVIAVFVITQVENNLNSLQCDTSNITTINYSIFIEWNIRQQLTQIKKNYMYLFAGCVSEAMFLQKKAKTD